LRRARAKSSIRALDVGRIISRGVAGLIGAFTPKARRCVW
jgi:hypothetical protein